MRTFKIVSWPDRPKKELREQWIPLDCEKCGLEASVPVVDAPPVIAAQGMSMIFDTGKRPPYSRPKVIQCRNCGKQYVR